MVRMFGARASRPETPSRPSRQAFPYGLLSSGSQLQLSGDALQHLTNIGSWQ
jgi:hypothetical protein